MTVKGVEINSFMVIRCPGADFLQKESGATMDSPIELDCGRLNLDRAGKAVFCGFVCTEVENGMCNVSKTAKRCTFAI